MSKSPIIVGVDPGTTSGIAILNMEGDQILVDSYRGAGLNEFIQRISGYGIPVIIGTDKSKVPDMIEKIAAKTGAKVVFPKYDLKVDEKKRMTHKYKFHDSHQMDALASALLALKEHEPLIKKIRKYTSSQAKEEIYDDLLKFVFKEDIPIKVAADLLESKDEETVLVKKAIHEKQFTKENYIRLYQKLTALQKENRLLRKYSAELRNKQNNLEIDLKKLTDAVNKKNNIKSQQISKLFQFKEDRFKSVQKQLEEKADEIDDLKLELKEVNSFIASISTNIIGKKLRNLGLKDFEEKQPMLKIKKGDVLVVDDCNIYNPKVIGELKEKITAIITKTGPSKKTRAELPFELIHDKSLIINEEGHFAILKKFQKNSNKEILQRIIQDYKRNRP